MKEKHRQQAEKLEADRKEIAQEHAREAMRSDAESEAKAARGTMHDKADRLSP